MIRKVADSLGGEVAEDRNYNCLIGVDGQEGVCPAGGVLCAEGNLVALLDSCSLEEKVEFLYVLRHLAVGDCLAFIVAQGRPVPISLDSLFKYTEIMFHNVL